MKTLLRALVAVVAVGFVLSAADVVLGHWHVVTLEESDWRMWIPVIFSPLAAIIGLWAAIRPRVQTLRLFLSAMLISVVVGVLGVSLHLLPKLGELGIAALRAEPPIGAPGVFILLGITGWLAARTLAQAMAEAGKVVPVAEQRARLKHVA